MSLKINEIIIVRAFAWISFIVVMLIVNQYETNILFAFGVFIGMMIQGIARDIMDLYLWITDRK